MICLHQASPTELRWCQQQVAAHHYLRKRVDQRASPVAYVVSLRQEPVGCLIFGRPESTRCFQGDLTYGSLAEVQAGRVRYSRWEILNLARVWLDPRIQRGGADHVPNAATQILAAALRRIGYDYLLRYPPIFPDEPYQIRVVLSYCDTRLHRGTIYKAAGFALARQAGHIQTWMRPIRPLRRDQRQHIERLIWQSERGRRYRAARQTNVQTIGMDAYLQEMT